MPIYEYECQKCGHTLEALQKFSDKPLRECPECGRHSLKRLVSAPLFRLGGSGWYETDFKSEKERKRNLAEKGEKEPAAAASETSGGTTGVAAEKKPETPSTGKPRTMVTSPAVTSPGKTSKPAPVKPAAKATRKAAKPASRRPAARAARKR
jgi:putative FmdB family regulatory protein